MNPIHYNEISYYIGKRIKMILYKNINLTYISVYINLQKNKVKTDIYFNICNKEYKYINMFKINKILNSNDIVENLINYIIRDFEIKYNM